jgi:hypothetical protein
VTEDSGTFKTNPRNRARIGHFVIRNLPRNHLILAPFRPFGGEFVCRFSATTDGGGLLYSEFSLIRGGESG